MSEIDTTTTPATEAPVAAETTVTPQTIGEVLIPEVKVEKPANQIPESVFLQEKSARKEAEKKIKELEETIKNGATKSEVSSDIESIAKEFDIDPSFLDKFAKTIRSETETKLKSELDSKFKPMEEKEKETKINAAFEVHFGKALESMPEFKDIVNPQVIKSLSLLPQNVNKTFPQLIEETYGNALNGKRTLPTTTPGGGKEPAPLDFQRAKKDTAYFNEIMANPKTKEEYNSRMLREGF